MATRRINCRRCGGEGKLRQGGQRSRYFQCDACEGRGYTEVAIPKAHQQGGQKGRGVNNPNNGTTSNGATSNGLSNLANAQIVGKTARPKQRTNRPSSAERREERDRQGADTTAIDVNDVEVNERGSNGSGPNTLHTGNNNSDNGETVAENKKKRVNVNREEGATNLDISINCTYLGQVAAIVCFVVGLLVMIANKSVGAFIMGVVLLLIGLVVGYTVFGEKLRNMIKGEGT